MSKKNRTQFLKFAMKSANNPLRTDEIKGKNLKTNYVERKVRGISDYSSSSNSSFSSK
jgi:hypothetical protein